MQQLQNETALSFLICHRKQVWIAASLGCNDFNDDTIICNIALEGINSNLSLYQATIAREKDKLLLNPGAMNLASLEETFFALDNSWSSKVKTGFKKYPRNERAKAAHQQHKSNAKRPQNKCPPHIKCYVCGANHWATQCPQRKNGDRSKEGSKEKANAANSKPSKSKAKKLNTFESGHVASQNEEQCKVADGRDPRNWDICEPVATEEPSIIIHIHRCS